MDNTLLEGFDNNFEFDSVEQNSAAAIDLEIN